NRNNFHSYWRFLISEIGLCWRCVGIDSNLASSQGINVEISIPLALGLANSLISLAGGLLAHYQRFADVNMGIGIIMVGLASVFIGQSFEVFFKKRHHYCKIGAQVFCVLIGSILYRIIITMAYELGLPTSVFNLVTASLVFLALLSPAMRKNWTTVFSRK
ncbi:MAG: hypothetical protein OEV87_01330, partial [Phycisphaerae bacterium]|nr:hypothetical protein [Phycisphaerae bacterium]